MPVNIKRGFVESTVCERNGPHPERVPGSQGSTSDEQTQTAAWEDAGHQREWTLLQSLPACVMTKSLHLASREVC